MIAALIAVLFLGGGIENAVLDYIGFMRGSVDEVVSDEERQAQAKTTLKDMKKLTNAYSKSNQKAFKTLLAEMSNLDTNADAIGVLWDDYYQDVESYNKQMIDLRFELRESLTRDEWEQIFTDSGE